MATNRGDLGPNPGQQGCPAKARSLGVGLIPALGAAYKNFSADDARAGLSAVSRGKREIGSLQEGRRSLRALMGAEVAFRLAAGA